MLCVKLMFRITVQNMGSNEGKRKMRPTDRFNNRIKVNGKAANYLILFYYYIFCKQFDEGS